MFILKDDCGKFLMSKCIEHHLRVVNWEQAEAAEWESGRGRSTWSHPSPI